MMNGFMALVFGSRQTVDHVIRGTKREVDLEMSCPPKLSAYNRALWKICATGDKKRARLLINSDDCEIGTTIEIFHRCGLMYNIDALENLAIRSDLKLDMFVAMAKFRRRAVITLLEIGQDLTKKSGAYATNSRSVRLIIAAAISDIDEILIMLSSLYDAEALHGLSLREAVRCGNAPVAALLLSETDVNPGANRSALLVEAATQDDDETFEVIFYDPRVSLCDAGTPAILAAICTGMSGRALLIMHDERWDGSGCEQVIDTIESLDKSSCDYVPLMTEISRSMKERARRTNAELKRIRNVTKLIKDSSKTPGADGLLETERRVNRELAKVGGVLSHISVRSAV